VLRRPYARAPFDGEGAYRFGGRWSSPGTRLSYASEHQSLAMLEYFVHLDTDDPPDDLVLAAADVPDKSSRKLIAMPDLPANWRDPAAPPELAHFGDDFVQRGEQCLLLVPSVLAPNEKNVLINPSHSEFSRVVVSALEPLNYDARMLAGRRRSHIRRDDEEPGTRGKTK
jgi:RES domain-containing protein